MDADFINLKAVQIMLKKSDDRQKSLPPRRAWPYRRHKGVLVERRSRIVFTTTSEIGGTKKEQAQGRMTREC